MVLPTVYTIDLVEMAGNEVDGYSYTAYVTGEPDKLAVVEGNLETLHPWNVAIWMDNIKLEARKIVERTHGENRNGI